jgi:spore coat polysaccharide biosynthesis protein SpsF
VAIVVSDEPADDESANLAQSFGARCFRGKQQDALTHLIGAARHLGADVVLHMGSNCPLFEPQAADRVLAELTGHLASCDYASNALEPTYPRGLELEAFTFGALSWIDRLANMPEERAGEVPAAARLRETLLCRWVRDDEDNSDLRWTVENADDLEYVRRLYEELDLAAKPVGYREIVAYARKNAKSVRKPTRRRSKRAA